MAKYFTQLVVFSLVLSTSICAQDSLGYFWRYNWNDIHFLQPTDSKKWQDFQLEAYMYARTIENPEEKTLGLIFNVIDVGDSNKVNEATIFRQIEILNDAFAGKYRNSTDREYSDVIAGDTKIRFCLGDPKNTGSSINFRETTITTTKESFGEISKSEKGINPLNQELFVNIWITELPDRFRGITYLPGVDSEKDGIYIDPDYFGEKEDNRKYSEGLSLAHLMGQYLSLRPLWTNLKCEDDWVEDTPISNAPNDICYPFSHVSGCAGNPEEMIGNFMDGNSDECAFMFTKGQMARMHYCLSERGYRAGLLSSDLHCGMTLIEYMSKVDGRGSATSFDFTFKPNPAYEYIDLSLIGREDLSFVDVLIYNSMGQLYIKDVLDKSAIDSRTSRIEVANLPTGSYVITLVSNGGTISKEFIKI